MRSIRALLAVALLGALALPTAGQQAADDGTEPPLELEVHVDGKATQKAELDRPFKLDAPAGSTVTIHAAPTRVFKKQGVSFRYPRDFSFKFEVKPNGIHKWSLTRADAELVVYQFENEADAAQARRNFSNGLIRATKVKVSSQDTTLERTKREKLAGTQVDAQYPHGPIRWTVFSWQHPDKGSGLLSLKTQSKDDEAELMTYLKETLALPGEK